MKQLNKIKFAKRSRPDVFPTDDPRLGRKLVSRLVALVRCWNSGLDRLTHNKLMEGLYLGADGQPILDEAGKAIPLHVEPHLHNPCLLKEAGASFGQVINCHAYLEDEAILGSDGDYVAVEIRVESVAKSWKVLGYIIKDIEEKIHDRSAIDSLTDLLAQIKCFVDDAPRFMNEAGQAMLQQNVKVLQDKASQAFFQSSEDLADEAVKSILEEIKEWVFTARVYPVSLYPVSPEFFLEELRAGRLGDLKLRPGKNVKETDMVAVVQKHDIRDSAATIAVQNFSASDMEKILEELFSKGIIDRKEMISLKEKFSPVSAKTSIAAVR